MSSGLRGGGDGDRRLPPRGAGAALASVILACGPPATVERVADPPRDSAPPAPSCEAAPDGALAVLSSATCPWMLVPDGSGAQLRPAEAGARPLRVEAPAECRPCRYAGVVTAAGPVVLATRASATSELAAAAWIGAADGSVLAFAPLWLDRPALGDSTFQGPPYALAPHVCGASLVLWPEARLPGARGEEPSPALVRARGAYAVRGGELVRLQDDVPGDMSGCTRVPIELP